MDRGKLRLAWDSWQAGDCREALGYLEEVRPESGAAEESARLLVECLVVLGRHGEAEDLLVGPRGRLLGDGDELLREVYLSWAWEATRREDYGDALTILERGRGALPHEGSLHALTEATRFRRRLAGALAGSKPPPPHRGEAALLRKAGEGPRGPDWVPAYPWRMELPWVPRLTAREWMPRLAARLDAEGKVLWVRISREELGRAVAEVAAGHSLRASMAQGELRLGRGGETVSFSLEEWAYRAAAEGLGTSGVAAAVVTLAEGRLRDRREIVQWVQDNRGEISVEPLGEGVLRLRHPKTGRVFVLDPEEWAEVFRDPSGEWATLWADLAAELGRSVRPYRCFCGRRVFLREVLVADPGEGLVLARGSGFSAVAAALCDRHRQLVTGELARSWGAGEAELAARLREDARRHPWDISFSRRDAGGVPYLLLEGEGVAALGRSPGLLLGVLEGIEGVAARGRTVLVFAPTPETLLVTEASTPYVEADAAAVRVVLERPPLEGPPERLGFRARLRLAERGEGVFRLRVLDEPL
ncbi:MAG: hypothetical protein SCH98_18405 [Deferrisomatales bacterium]|nr:hypothetical protein [Deferrisomatales bacterium]